MVCDLDFLLIFVPVIFANYKSTKKKQKAYSELLSILILYEL